MKAFSVRHLIAGLAMLIAAGLALAMVPDRKLADLGPQVDLEIMIPKQMGDWRLDESIAPVLPSPDLQAQLKKIYTQTLSRTYINSKGVRIMLSIAYGREQYGGLQTHVPEICYPAQGFELLKLHNSQVETRFGTIQNKRLVARLGQRTEPITYWMTVGDSVVRVGWQWRLAQLKYSLTGAIPEGMLVRVSNISIDEPYSYEQHQAFIDAMLGALDAGARAKFIGAFRLG